MIKGYKVMLKPNNKQRTKLFQFAGAARFAYNWALNKQMTAFREGEKLISNYDLRKEFTVLRHSEEFCWLESVSNNVTKQAIKDCCDAYSKFFAKQKRKGYVKFSKKKLAHFARIGKKPTVYDMNGHPKFKSRKHSEPKFFQDDVKIRFSATHVKLESIADSKRRNRQQANWIRLAEHGRIPVDAKYASPRVTFDGENWWISVAVEVPDEPVTGIYNDSLGIDLGIKKLAVLSDNIKVKNINKTKKVRKLKKTQRRLQRQVSRKYQMNKKGDSYCKTCNITKIEHRLLRINHRLAGLRRNHLHLATTSIVRRKPSLICLEDLNVQGMMANKHLAEAVQEQGFYEFRRQIEYKAARAGVPVVIADRYFSSSKTCCRCGHVKKDLKLSERTFVCPVCGNRIDRDLQAAINLRDYGERQMTQKSAS